VCIDGECGDDPCADVRCPAGRVCRGGACADDPCLTLRCPLGEACYQGECAPSSEVPDAQVIDYDATRPDRDATADARLGADGGGTDGGGNDAAAAPDAGQLSLTQGAGCTCQTGRRGDAAWTLFALGLGVLARRRRGRGGRA
jgi:hypothetical protein